MQIHNLFSVLLIGLIGCVAALSTANGLDASDGIDLEALAYSLDIEDVNAWQATMNITDLEMAGFTTVLKLADPNFNAGNNTVGPLSKRKIPDGRKDQKCDTDEAAGYKATKAIAKYWENHAGYVYVKKGDCKRIAEKHYFAGINSCVTLCAKGDNREVHFQRLSAILNDIIVGCHHNSSPLHVSGIDFFEEYNVEAHHCK